MTYGGPIPGDDLLMKPFWENARRQRLSVQHCLDCGDLHFPPSPVCPVCLSEDQDWATVSGKAHIVSWVTFHRAYWDAFVGQLPYDVCLVRLAEGPLMISNFAGERPEGLHEGLPVRVVFEPVSESVTLPRFTADV
ncbi:MAG: OB-fold domain-containing protein [Sphingomonas sp.]